MKTTGQDETPHSQSYRVQDSFILSQLRGGVPIRLLFKLSSGAYAGPIYESYHSRQL